MARSMKTKEDLNLSPIRKERRRAVIRRGVASKLEQKGVVIIEPPQGKAEAYTRQVSYDDVFSEIYGSDPEGIRIIKPPYSPGRLYEICEESSILPQCVWAMALNVHGFGTSVVPLRRTGSETEDELPKAALTEKKHLEEFMDYPNDQMSGRTLRMLSTVDYEVTGNMYLEVIRRGGRPELLFWADARRVRICTLSPEWVPVTVTVPRNGTLRKVQTVKQFRRYVMSQFSSTNEGTTKLGLRFFKEYGDPREMDAFTGKYMTKEVKTELAKQGKTWLPASEIWHHKQGNGTYGVPRWAGNALNIMGLTRADFVNYDLFNSQGIPPLAVLVSGGRLTDESLEDLTELIMSAKGVSNFNKTLLLETEGLSSGGVDENSPGVKIELKSLIDYRKDDAMFTEYSSAGRKSVRESFRLPSLFVGGSEDYNYATATIARATAEEQVFAPERQLYDEHYNRSIVRDLGVQHVKTETIGPTSPTDELAKALTPELLKYGAFTLNELIEYTNRVLGTDFPIYQGKKWAEVPLPVFLSIAQLIAEPETGLKFPEPPQPGASAPRPAGGTRRSGNSKPPAPSNSDRKFDLSDTDFQSAVDWVDYFRKEVAGAN